MRRLLLGTTHVVLQPDFLDAAACAELRHAMDAGEATPAEIHDGAYRVDLTVRRTAEIDVDDAIVARVERLLAAARDEIGRAFGVVLTGAEGPGFLRYHAGGFYRAHQDALDTVDDQFPRLLSVVLFLTGTSGGAEGASLTDTCTGGALRLHGTTDSPCEPVDVVPRRGMVVIFPARLVHEVLPVTAGIRDVIVDWLY